jgi:hypothetical protein
LEEAAATEMVADDDVDMLDVELIPALKTLRAKHDVRGGRRGGIPSRGTSS